MAATHITVTDFTTIGGELSADRMRYSMPLLEIKTAKGAQQTWQIHVSIEDMAGHPVQIQAEYFNPRTAMPGLRGRLDVDAITNKGNKRESAATYVLAGKNIGKKNETNVFCQALRDALSKHNSQKKTSAGHTGAGKPRFYPMLAKVYADFQPGWLSAKFDGLRAVTTWSAGCMVYSRTLADYAPISAICDEIRPLLEAHPEIYLDGELYCHGMPLQKIASAVKKQKGDAAALVEKIVYCVYDCIFTQGGAILPMKFSERYEKLRGLFREYGVGPRVVLVTHTYVDSQAAIDELYDQHRKDGYEGSILRIDAPYDSRANNYHSPYLLKIKPRFDAEFEVVGWALSDAGKSAGAIMMEFITPAGNKFWATPAMPLAERVELGKKMPAEFAKKWKGKMITVYYAGLSVDGTPLQPTTKLIGRFD